MGKIIILLSFFILGVQASLGIFYYPHHFFLFDELNSVSVSGKLLFSKFNPHWFIYPSFYLYFLFVLYSLVSLLLMGSVESISFSSAKQLLYRYSHYYILFGRFFSLIFTFISLYLLYLIGKKIFQRKKLAVLPPLVFVFLYPVVYLSYHIKPDAMMLALFLSGFYLYVRKKYQWAYIFFGLSIGTKYNPAFFVLPFLIVDIFKGKIKLFLKHLLIIILFFFLTTPYALLDFDKFISDLMQLSKMARYGGHLYYMNYKNNLYYTLKVAVAQVLGIWGSYIFILSLLVGIYFLIKARDEKVFILYFNSCLGIVLFASGNILHINYFYIVIPFFILLIFYVLDRLKLPYLFVFSVALSICYSGFKESTWDLLRKLQEEDSRFLALKWVIKNISEGSSILLENNIPPIADDSIPPCPRKYKVKKLPFLYSAVMDKNWYKKDESFLPQNFRNYLLKYDFIIVNSWNVNPVKRNKRLFSKRYSFYQYLEKKLNLVAFFRPSGMGPGIWVFQMKQSVSN